MTGQMDEWCSLTSSSTIFKPLIYDVYFQTHFLPFIYAFLIIHILCYSIIWCHFFNACLYLYLDINVKWAWLKPGKFIINVNVEILLTHYCLFGPVRSRFCKKYKQISSFNKGLIFPLATWGTPFCGCRFRINVIYNLHVTFHTLLSV